MVIDMKPQPTGQDVNEVMTGSPGSLCVNGGSVVRVTVTLLLK